MTDKVLVAKDGSGREALFEFPGVEIEPYGDDELIVYGNAISYWSWNTVPSDDTDKPHGWCAIDVEIREQ